MDITNQVDQGPKRYAGILVHPTSFPGPYGIGDLGKGAYDFIDFVKDAGMSVWQMLPIGPTGYAESPYQSTSTYAGSPLMIEGRRYTLRLHTGARRTGRIEGDEYHLTLPDPGCDADVRAAIRSTLSALTSVISIVILAERLK